MLDEGASEVSATAVAVSVGSPLILTYLSIYNYRSCDFSINVCMYVCMYVVYVMLCGLSVSEVIE